MTAGSTNLGVVDLVNALVREEDCLVIWSQQNSSERSLPESHGSSLHRQGCFNPSRDLRRGDGFACRKQIGSAVGCHF